MVLEQFEKGVTRYGLPCRVRSDYGMENLGVVTYMLEHPGLGTGRIITGNPPITAEWKELETCTL
jgi:hypothetical protein